MNILAIFLGVIILAGLGYYVTRPLRQSSAYVGGADTLPLEAQRDAVYVQIKELDQDHDTGKVNDEDYARLRAELVAQATALLKQIDGAVAPIAARQPAPQPAAVDDLEALIAARRKTRSAPAAKPAEPDVEAAIAARRKTAAPVVSTALFCPKCGKPVNAGDVFCAKCGAALPVTQ